MPPPPAVGALAGGYLFEEFGFRGTFLTVALFCVVVAACTSFVLLHSSCNPKVHLSGGWRAFILMYICINFWLAICLPLLGGCVIVFSEKNDLYCRALFASILDFLFQLFFNSFRNSHRRLRKFPLQNPPTGMNRSMLIFIRMYPG